MIGDENAIVGFEVLVEGVVDVVELVTAAKAMIAGQRKDGFVIADIPGDWEIVTERIFMERPLVCHGFAFSLKSCLR